MVRLQRHLLTWAGVVCGRLARLAESTGSVEGWLRGEAILAAADKGFGRISNLKGEASRWDLSFQTQQGQSVIVEFKCAWNNKNLLGGYNGTGGILKDIEKLRYAPADLKFVVVFFTFYDRRTCGSLPPSFHARSGAVPLQLEDEDGDFAAFAKSLAASVVSRVTSGPAEPVHELRSDANRWFGVWIHEVG